MVAKKFGYIVTLIWLCLAFSIGTLNAQTVKSDNHGSELGYLDPKIVKPVDHGDVRYRTPAMIGDFHGGSLGFSGNSIADRLVILADDLDAPNVLAPGSSQLTMSEPGPVGIFSTSLQSATELQSLLRSGSPIPGATLVSVVNSNATLTTSNTIAQLQAQLASTGQPFDIIAIQPPPSAYDNAVQAAFLMRNGSIGATSYNAALSGAFMQGGVDTLSGGEDFDAYYFYDYLIRFDTALADATSGGVGRMKIAEGGTILPQDRLFFRYNYLDNVRYSNGGQHLNRYVPGMERYFFDRLMSLEVRAPFASNTTSDSTYNGSSISNSSDTRFGNLSLYVKGLLLDTGSLAVSGGLGVILPTASDIKVNYADGTTLLNVANQSVHLQPFLGALYTPSDKLFIQSFVQWDGPVSGNNVRMNVGNGLQSIGRLSDSNMLYVDAGIGYWLYKSDYDEGITGVIPTLEIHQNSSLQNGEIVTSGPFQVGDFTGTSSLTNIVAGSTFEFGTRTQFTAAYVGPIGGGADRQFNGGLQFFVSRLFN